MIYKCPVCSDNLIKDGRSFRCPNNHTFDIGKEGYVNLLLANQKKSKEPGDPKQMVEARKNFLDKGFYSKLANFISELILKESSSKESLNILDLGCGTGYYIGEIKKYLDKNTSTIVNYYGMDISKQAVQISAKKYKDINFAVGSSKKLPFMDGSFDIVVSVFSPMDFSEVRRVLNKSGKVIIVGPGVNHLLSLVKLIYKTYKLHEFNINYKSFFEQEFTTEVSFSLQLQSSVDVFNLISMTPYYWRIDEKDMVFFKKVSRLDTEAEFVIKVLKLKQ